ncbi:BTAD domain-containing putative transcriptional regulator [Kitasatospora putterlickiae]|uniref:BTAD domain-containing putative transcriptional regulator n=1 Tax=Kitasatospora putterlickiae TaxID=221725 RepID=A0ABN1YDI1_9ACTN
MGAQRTLHFLVLGTVEAWDGEQRLPLGGPVQERVLVTLLLENGRVVPVARLVEAAWGELPPSSAEHQVRKAVSDLRRRLPGGAAVIVTDGPGYRTDTTGFALDLTRFTDALRTARQALAEERAQDAVTALSGALALWRGPVMAGRGSPVIDAAATAWNERRLAAADQYFDLRLARGEAGELVGDLRALIADHPFRETLRGHLMLALYRAGRAAEALEEYGTVRVLLAEELGTDPGAPLTTLHERILRADPGLDAPPPAPASAPAAPPTPDTATHRAHRTREIRTLPYDLPDFTGRDSEVRQLLERARPDGDDSTRVIALDGMGGIGKTTLAVHVAHRLAPHYPDAQLHIDLRGFTPGEEPLQPAAALESLLRTVTPAEDHLPNRPEERSRAWRAALAGRRVLLLLDNAADSAQVLPLLPASPGCLVLVTSRARLMDLDSAEWFSLGMLAPEDSRALLTRTLGAERAGAEPEAVDRLGELCGQLPLALRITASRLRNRPRWSVHHLVERLSQETRRLDELSAGQRSVTATLELSYQALDARQRTVFRLLGRHPAAEIDIWSTAALAAVPAREAEAVLEHLLDAHLLVQHTQDLYSIHDLVRDFSRSLSTADGDDGEADGPTAARRLLSYYLSATEAACVTLFPDRLRFEEVADPPAAQLPPWKAPEDALAWFDREHHAIRYCLDQEGDSADPRQTLRLSRNLAFYFYTRSRVEEQVEQGFVAVRAARRLAVPHLLSLSLNNLAVARWRCGHFTDGIASAVEALDISRRSGDRQQEAISVGRLGLLHSALGNLPTALSYLEQAVVLRRETGDEVGEGESWTNLSSVYRWLERLPEAADAARHAVRLNRHIGARDNEKIALVELAVTRLCGDDPAGALESLEQALALGDETRRPENHALALAHTAETRQLLGERTGVLAFAEHALDLVARCGARLRLAEVENIAGRVHRGNGDASRARHLHTSALEHSEALGYRVESAGALAGLARACADLGESAAAAEHLHRARRLFEEIGMPATRYC